MSLTSRQNSTGDSQSNKPRSTSTSRGNKGFTRAYDVSLEPASGPSSSNPPSISPLKSPTLPLSVENLDMHRRGSPLRSKAFESSSRDQVSNNGVGNQRTRSSSTSRGIKQGLAADNSESSDTNNNDSGKDRRRTPPKSARDRPQSHQPIKPKETLGIQIIGSQLKRDGQDKLFATYIIHVIPPPSSAVKPWNVCRRYSEFMILNDILSKLPETHADLNVGFILLVSI